MFVMLVENNEVTICFLLITTTEVSVPGVSVTFGNHWEFISPGPWYFRSHLVQSCNTLSDRGDFGGKTSLTLLTPGSFEEMSSARE